MCSHKNKLLYFSISNFEHKNSYLEWHVEPEILHSGNISHDDVLSSDVLQSDGFRLKTYDLFKRNSTFCIKPKNIHRNRLKRATCTGRQRTSSGNAGGENGGGEWACASGEWSRLHGSKKRMSMLFSRCLVSSLVSTAGSSLLLVSAPYRQPFVHFLVRSTLS